MTPAPANLRSIEQRLHSLESANRRLRVVATGLLAVAIVAGCLDSGGGDPPQAMPAPAPGVAGIVEADAFVLRDGKGGVAARLELGETGPRLVLYGEPEVAGAILQADPFGSELRLDAKGKRRLHLESSAHANLARLSFADDAGRTMLQALTESGLSSVFLLGEANDKGVRAQIGLMMPPAGAPQLMMRTSDLKMRNIAPTD